VASRSLPPPVGRRCASELWSAGAVDEAGDYSDEGGGEVERSAECREEVVVFHVVLLSGWVRRGRPAPCDRSKCKGRSGRPGRPVRKVGHEGSRFVAESGLSCGDVAERGEEAGNF
jgi:hypothetical protein